MEETIQQAERTEYDGRTDKYRICHGGNAIERKGWEEFEQYCTDNSVVPVNIICFNTSHDEVVQISQKKEGLIARISDSAQLKSVRTQGI
jgi:hypothetical protein